MTKAEDVVAQLPDALRLTLLARALISEPNTPELLARAVLQELAFHAIFTLLPSLQVDREMLRQLLFDEPSVPETAAPNATDADYTIPNREIPTAVFAATKVAKYALPGTEPSPGSIALNRLRERQKTKT
jgi:hypothetical protein